MRILYIIDSLSSGGKERQLVELLKGIGKKENIIAKLIILSEKIDYRYVDDLNTDIYVIKRKTKKDLGVFRKIYRLCKEFKPDVIHSWETMCSIYSLPISKLLGIKFINGIIRSAPAKVDVFSKNWLYTNLTFPFSDIILSNSNAGLSSYQPPRHKSYCIHNGFDLNRIKYLTDAKDIRNRFELVTDNIVGMVARFDESKDYITYLKGAMEILQRTKNVTFLAIGDGNTLKKCLEIVPAKFKEYIRFLGKQNEVESIINVFDIGVLTTYTEGISNVLMEYMALGKPVIATKNAGNEEIVQDNWTGLLVRPLDVSDLVNKIEYLIHNKNIGVAMGKAGKERLRNDFSLEKMTDSHIKLYERCVV